MFLGCSPVTVSLRVALSTRHHRSYCLLLDRMSIGFFHWLQLQWPFKRSVHFWRAPPWLLAINIATWSRHVHQLGILNIRRAITWLFGIGTIRPQVFAYTSPLRVLLTRSIQYQFSPVTVPSTSTCPCFFCSESLTMISLCNWALRCSVDYKCAVQLSRSLMKIYVAGKHNTFPAQMPDTLASAHRAQSGCVAACCDVCHLVVQTAAQYWLWLDRATNLKLEMPLHRKWLHTPMTIGLALFTSSTMPFCGVQFCFISWCHSFHASLPSSSTRLPLHIWWHTFHEWMSYGVYDWTGVHLNGANGDNRFASTSCVVLARPQLTLYC